MAFGETGAHYRLLSEAEREYATRACVTACQSTPFWFGAEIAPDRANYDWRYSYAGSAKAMPPRRTVPTDEFTPNPFDLSQVTAMSANGSGIAGAPLWPGFPATVRPGCPATAPSMLCGAARGRRAGKNLRSAKRSWEMSTERRAEIGFRVARSLGD